MKNSLPDIFSLCSLLFLSACSAISQASPTAADTLEPSETPTNTPVPPTPTPTIPPPTLCFYPDAITAETAPQIEELEQLGRGSIYGMAVSPNGDFLAMSTTIGVWIYSLPDGEALHYFEDIPLDTWFDKPDIAWSPDGMMLAVGRKNNGVRVWDAASWELLTERDITDGYVLDLPGIAWSPDGRYLAVGSGEQAVWVWDKTLDTWEDWSNYTGHQVGLTWTEDGQLLMIGGMGKGIFDVTTGEYLQPLDHWIDGLGKVSWSPDSQSVLIMFDLGGGVMNVPKNEYAFPAGEFPVNSAWSLDGKYFATSSSGYGLEPGIRIYDTQTYELVLHKPEVSAGDLAWTPSGELLATSAFQGERVLLNVHTGEVLFSLDSHRGYSNFIIWQYDDLDISDFDNSIGNIRVLDEDEDIYILTVHSISGQYDFSYGHSMVVTVDDERRLHIWTPDSHRILPADPDRYPSQVRISPDGTLLAIGESHGDVEIFDTAEGSLITVLPGSEYINLLSWSPDMEKLYVCRGSESEKLYNVGDWTYTAAVDFRYDILWSWDGDRLFFEIGSDQTSLVNLETQETLMVFDTGGGISYSQSPYRTMFVIKRSNSPVYEIWDIVNKELVSTLEYQTNYFGRMAWSLDQALLAMGCEDGRLLIWDVETGDLLVDLMGHKDRISHITWSQDGSKLYTTSEDGTFRVWGIPR